MNRNDWNETPIGAETPTWTFQMPPPSPGYWRFPGSSVYATELHMSERPRWLTRKLMWWLLEFKWIDAAK